MSQHSLQLIQQVNMLQHYLHYILNIYYHFPNNIHQYKFMLKFQINIHQHLLHMKYIQQFHNIQLNNQILQKHQYMQLLRQDILHKLLLMKYNNLNYILILQQRLRNHLHLHRIQCMKLYLRKIRNQNNQMNNLQFNYYNQHMHY